MQTEVIHGTVESASVKRSNEKIALYDNIVFRQSDGSERRVETVAVAPAVAAALQPGTQGRFYAYKALDHRGLVAMRTKDGRAAFVMPSGNEKIMMIAALGGLLWLVMVLLTRDAITFLGLAMALFGGFAWWSYRKMRIENRARYDADSGYPQTDRTS
ncbi:MAG: hypothetical protein ABI451_11420 [Dokdonella sp.]